ncbi:unnamed protein product [Ectocarpus sp. 4 AP-2014]
MEPYRRESTGKFPLSLLAAETCRGVGISGASAPCRALLGLGALYATVDANRRKLAHGGAGGSTPGEKTHDRSSRTANGCGGNAAIPGSAPGRGRGVVTRSSGTKQGTAAAAAALAAAAVGWRSSATEPPPSPRVSAEAFAAMPLLGHRYRYVSTIGTGRFSDVVRAQDTFRPGRSVAVKVLNLGCGAIGIREVRFMRFLSSVPHSEFRPVIRLLDALTYQGHYCLVTELFSGTLSLSCAEGGAGQRERTSVPAAAAAAAAAAEAAEAEAAEAAALPTTTTHNNSSTRSYSSAVEKWSVARLFVDQGTRESLGGFQRTGAPTEPSGRLGWGSLAGVGASSPCGGGLEDSVSSNGSSSVGRKKGERGAGDGGAAGFSSGGGGCPVAVIRHVALQLVSALLLLHSHGLIHADVKPENVLLRMEGRRQEGEEEEEAGHRGRPLCLADFVSGRAGGGGGGGVERLTVKLGDLGSAIHRSETYLFYGDFEIQTLAYRAPEASVLMGCPFGPAVDVWGVGVILLELLLGRPLFDTAGSRVALVHQTVCALGPMPLRRFRVGHYFSEYFPKGMSLQAGIPTANSGDEHMRMGCCSCCWIGVRRSPDEDPDVSSCDGCCALRCRRLSDMRGDGSAAPLAAAAAERRGLGPPAGSTGYSSSEACISRLIGASPPPPSPPQQAPAAAEHAAAAANSASEHHHRHRQHSNHPLLARPKPRRPPSATTAVAGQKNKRLLSLISGLLRYDPDERLTPAQALAHPFFGETLPFAVLPPTAVAPGLGQTSGGGGGGAAAARCRTAEPTAPAQGEHHGGRRQPPGPKPTGAATRPVAASRRQEEEPARRKSLPDGSGGVDNGWQRARHEEATTSTCRSGSVDAGAARASPARVVSTSTPSRRHDNVAGSRSNGTSSVPPRPTGSSFGAANSREEAKPTAQLQQLAEMAEVIVKDNSRYSRGRAGGTGNGTGNGKDNGSAPAPAPRRNRFLNTERFASLKRESSPAEPEIPAVSGTPTKEGRHHAQPPPAATTSGRRRPNRFLTPATLAILKPDLGVTRRQHADDTAAAAAGGWATSKAATSDAEVDKAGGYSGLCAQRTTSASTTKATPPPAAHQDPSSMEKVQRLSWETPGEAAGREAVVVATREPEDGGVQPAAAPSEQQEPCGTGRKRARRSATGDRARAANKGQGATTPSKVRERGRSTTPRRAAMAAQAAIIRLRKDDESSDGSLSL